MSGKQSFFCIDGHTCGNPVRLVVGGAPLLQGATMSERREAFQREHDWIRRGLMFEPRGHDIMSGAILYPPTRADCDIALLFIETSGCLPMCGHGTIGAVTFALEHGLANPAMEGRLRIETPAGVVVASYERQGRRVTQVRITYVPSYLHRRDIAVSIRRLGKIKVDVAYGGNFYAIVDSQANFADLGEFTTAELIDEMGTELRAAVNTIDRFVHPLNPAIVGVSHVLWTGSPTDGRAHARNAVLYGSGAIDRSPCGTGTSARMAQLVAKGMLGIGDAFIHESIIGSLFHGRVEAATKVGPFDAIVPSVAGGAIVTGLNTIFIDQDDPYAHGFSVSGKKLALGRKMAKAY
jgi:4-hydroxyproline epimerase